MKGEKDRLRIFLPRRFSFAALMLCVVTFATVAQREYSPMSVTPLSFTLPQPDTFTLQNGMKVTLVRYGAEDKVSMQAIVRVGALDERSGERWVSDMVATLLREGTTKRSGGQLTAEAAQMGGSLFTSAATDKTTVSGEASSEFATRLLGLVADVLRNPRFDSEDLEKIRSNKLREMIANRESPPILALEKFRRSIFPGHAYGSIIPTEGDLKAYTMQSVKAFYYNQFGAARTHLYVVGQFDPAKMKAEIDKSFGNWKKGPDPVRNPPKVGARRTLEIVDRPGVKRSTIYLGVPAMSQAEADFIKFSVMDSVLQTRLYFLSTTDVRAIRGNLLAPRSYVWSRYKTGYWIENAEAETEATGAAVNEILREIAVLQKNPASDEEMREIKDNLVGIYVSGNSTRIGVMGLLENNDYYELPVNYLDKFIPNLMAVTAADVSEMARKYLATERMTLVVVGDKSKITDQFKPYAK